MEFVNPQKDQQATAIYQTDDGALVVNTRIEGETVWLSLNQMAELFERDKSVISRHLKKVFSEKELDEKATVANFATVQMEGDRNIERQVTYYNLDAIISVGYRVNSKRGTQFRQWASQVLKDHMIQGYSINQAQINQESIKHLQQTVMLLSDTLIQHQLVDEMGSGVLYIIQEYAKTWDLLLRYDENRFDVQTQNICRSHLSYDKAIEAISTLKQKLRQDNQTLMLFGQEREQGLQAILGNLDQTFDGKLLYPSCEERAAHLLYFIIKDHPFADGNKRIASFLFLIQLQQDELSLKKINDNCLTALTLLIAQSHPHQKNTMVQLIMSLLLDQ